MNSRPILSAAITLNSQSTFTAEFNLSGGYQNELVEHMPGGKKRVLLKGMSRPTADALAQILNMPGALEG